MDKLMDRRIPADDDLVGDDHMTTQAGARRDRAVVRDLRVMAHMGVGHEVVVVADASGLIRLATMSCETFAEDVLIADDDARFGVVMVEPEVLRRPTDPGTGIQHVSVSNLSMSMDPVLAEQSCARLDHYWPGDQAMGAHMDIFIDGHIAFDDGGRMNG